MNTFWMVLLSVQVLVALAGFLFTGGKDERFSDEKMAWLANTCLAIKKIIR